MSNHITLSFCPEDRQRLDELGSVLGMIHGELLAFLDWTVQQRKLQAIENATAPQAEERFTNAAEEPPADILPPHGEPEPVAVAAQQYTQADILVVVQRLIAPGSTKRAQAKAIVNDYAPKISAIPADKYNEVMDRLTALERE